MRRTMLYLAAAMLFAMTLAACGSGERDAATVIDPGTDDTSPDGDAPSGDVIGSDETSSDDTGGSGEDGASGGSAASVFRVGSIATVIDCDALVPLTQGFVGSPGNPNIAVQSGGPSGTGYRCRAGGGGTSMGVIVDGADGGIDVVVETNRFTEDSPIEIIRESSLGARGISWHPPMTDAEAPEGWSFAGTTTSAESSASWHGLFVLSEDGVVLGCTLKLANYAGSPEDPAPPAIDSAAVTELCNEVRQPLVTD